MGVGTYYGYGYADIKPIPTLLITYDHGILDEVGPGNIGVGGVVGFRTTATDNGTNVNVSIKSFIIGVRGTYHLTLLTDKNEKFDPYGGVSTGFIINSYRNVYTGSQVQLTPYTATASDLFYGLFVGAKYNFSEKFGAFAELGYDINYLRAGICYNF